MCVDLDRLAAPCGRALGAAGRGGAQGGTRDGDWRGSRGGRTGADAGGGRARRALVEELKGELVDRGALGACMTGTGSTVYGLFSSQDQARAASDAMGKVWPETFLTHSL